jgi:hypothetical protein
LNTSDGYNCSSPCAAIIYIPSGGGKSTIATQFKMESVDVDSLFTMPPVVMGQDVDWDARNFEIRGQLRKQSSAVYGKILLIHSPSLVPQEWLCCTNQQVWIPLDPVLLRMGSSNRDSLITFARENGVEIQYYTIVDSLTKFSDYWNFITTVPIGTYNFLNFNPLAATLFTAAFHNQFPLVARSALILGSQTGIDPELAEMIRSQYAEIFDAYVEGKIPVHDLTMLHELAFGNNMPDDYYKHVNRNDPMELEDNRNIVDSLKEIDGMLHGLHVYDDSLFFHKDVNVTERQREYQALNWHDIRLISEKRSVAVFGTAKLIEFCTGYVLPSYKDNVSKGIWMSDNKDIKMTGVLTVGLSFHMVYGAYVKMGFKTKDAKIFAQKYIADAKGCDMRLGKYIGDGVGTKKMVSGRRFRSKRKKIDRCLAPEGRSAIKSSFSDRQTRRWQARKEAVDAMHANDGSMMEELRHSVPLQRSIFISLRELATNLNSSLASQEMVDLLYPSTDTGLRRRQRMGPKEILSTLQLLEKVTDLDFIMLLLSSTGGMGQQAFASLVLAAATSSDVRQVLPALLCAGVCAHGIKHYIDFTKSIHNLVRRTTELPGPLAPLLANLKVLMLDSEWYNVFGFTANGIPMVDASISCLKGKGKGSDGRPSYQGGPWWVRDLSGSCDTLIDDELQARRRRCASGLVKSMAQQASMSEISVNTRCSAVAPELYAIKDYCNLMYLNLLSGRFYDEKLANEGYVEKRSKEVQPHPLWEVGLQRVDAVKHWADGVDSAMAGLSVDITAAIRTNSDKTPEDFLSEYIQIAPTGSVGQDKRRLSGIEDKHNITKRAWLSTLQVEDLLSLLDEPTMIQTHQITKTEISKERALIPGPVVQWAIESVAMMYAEGAIYRSSREFTLESNAFTSYIAFEMRRRRTAEGRCTMNSDYADFNFLHTVADMQNFWRMVRSSALMSVTVGDWNGDNYSGFIVKCCDWLIDSLDHMYVREPYSDGEFVRVKRGLWSGWRTTSAINNTMNYVYYKILRASVASQLNVDPIISYELNGDDGDAEVSNIVDALFYLRLMSQSELDIQAVKQMVSNTRAEYLRIMYDQGVVKGSLNRSIGSFCSSDMQAPEIILGKDYAKGTSSAINGLIHRGGDKNILEQLRITICLNQATQTYEDMDRDMMRVPLHDYRMLFVAETSGGYGLSNYTGDCRYELVGEIKNWPLPDIKWVQPQIKNYGAGYLLSSVSRKLADAGIDPSIAASIADNAVNITNQGLSLDFGNRSQMNADSRRMAEHVEWLNSCSVKRADDVPIPDDVYTNTEYAMTQVFEGDELLLESMQFTDIEEMLAGWISKTLGLIGISRQAMHQMSDMETGHRLSNLEVLTRLATDIDFYAILTVNYPRNLVDALLTKNHNLPRDVGGLLTASTQPCLNYTQMTVLRAHDLAHGEFVTYEEYECLLKQINKAFTIIYLEKYVGRYND